MRALRFLTTITIVASLAVAAAPAASQEIGHECSPGDTAFRPGLSCLATEEFTDYQPYILNAKRGDLLLSSGCGLIGDLLRALPGDQEFSHSGIMVEDRTTVRHSTAAEGRYEVGAGSDGLVTDTIQYGWPGTVTESIFEAYEGHYRVDPNNNSVSWFFQSFNRDTNQCPGDPNPIFPSVVKPPFDQEEIAFSATGETVRAALNRVADEAENINAHYRFFAYSDADIVGKTSGPGARTPAGTSWAWAEQKLDGTVCSQLIWNAAHAAGITTLEDPVKHEDERPHVATAAKNGLYEYSEAERLTAAKFLYDEIYDRFYEESGWGGRLLTDAPDDGANQLVNCFAFDWCGEIPGFEWDGESYPKDSDRWKQPGLGAAVSPDDLTHWDLPTAGGLYGLTETMTYRTGGYRPKYAWAPSAGTGSLRVIVTFNSAPLNNVPVTLLGYPQQTTPANGSILFEAVEAGQQFVEAVTDVDVGGNRMEAKANSTVTIRPGEVTEITLNLQTPPLPPPSNTTEAHRRVTIHGSVYVEDFDEWPSDNETATCMLSDSTVLDPVTKTEHSFPFDCCADEVRSKGNVTVRLNPSDKSVFSRIEVTLFELTNCSNNDKDGEAQANVLVAKDGNGTMTATATNDEWRSDDFTRVQVNVKNERNQIP